MNKSTQRALANLVTACHQLNHDARFQVVFEFKGYIGERFSLRVHQHCEFDKSVRFEGDYSDIPKATPRNLKDALLWLKRMHAELNPRL